MCKQKNNLPLLLGLAGVALILASCNTATGGGDTGGGSVAVDNVLPINFNAATTIGSKITVTPDSGNNGYTGTLALALDSSAAEANRRTMDYTAVDNTSAHEGTSAWDPGNESNGTHDLSFQYATAAGASVTPADGHGGHTLLSFKNVSFGNLSGKTGLVFDLKMPEIPGSGSVGLTVFVRYNDGASQNASMYKVTLENHTNGANGFAMGTDYDWLPATSSHVWLSFKIPFSLFVKGGSQSETSIAASVTAGTVFNQLDFDFRMDTTAGSGSIGTVYNGYIDNIDVY